jgi:hypothetical protein
MDLGSLTEPALFWKYDILNEQEFLETINEARAEYGLEEDLTEIPIALDNYIMED